MSKSIKFKNDVYLDSSSIMYGRTTLENMLSRRFALKAVFSINDGETKTYDAGVNGVYLFINSHVYKRCILLITLFNRADLVKRFNVDVIYKSEDDAVPIITYNTTTNALTIQAKSSKQQIRGSLFKLNALAA